MTVVITKSDRDHKGFRLTTELLVEESRSRVFDFFADAYQLETITPAWLQFSVQTPPPIAMHAGTLIDYRLRLHGLPIRWRSKISSWEPPLQFVDEQVKGPYHYWHHLHTFEEVSGGTMVRDIVHYSVPLGFIVHPLLVRRDLTKIFEYRQETMAQIFTPISNSAQQQMSLSSPLHNASE